MEGGPVLENYFHVAYCSAWFLWRYKRQTLVRAKGYFISEGLIDTGVGRWWICCFSKSHFKWLKNLLSPPLAGPVPREAKTSCKSCKRKRNRVYPVFFLFNMQFLRDFLSLGDEPQMSWSCRTRGAQNPGTSKQATQPCRTLGWALTYLIGIKI